MFTIHKSERPESVYGVQAGFDFDAHYQDAGGGIAYVALGWANRWDPYTCLLEDEYGNEYEEETGEGEWTPDIGGRVVVVMVGDDRLWSADQDELTKIPEDSFCRDCGQIGCGCNVYV